jgi:hypothetical protein
MLLTLQVSCATHTKEVATGMLIGSVVGAGVGYQFVHHGEERQYETQNTLITSVVFALVTGGVRAWHYRSLEEFKVEMSGRYSRYRLCDPEEMQEEMQRELQLGDQEDSVLHQLDEWQIGSLAITLDDNTKWIYPQFRKRYLRAEQGENQVISKHYIWEIIKPGSFVTRSQNPHYFIQIEKEGEGEIEE